MKQGDIDDQGYVKNLEDLKNPLATMNEDKKSTVFGNAAGVRRNT